MPVANRLQQPLDRLYHEFDWARRVEQDAIQFPLRYTDPADIEIAGLFASCMAYGRVDLFGAWVAWVLARMGESPARFIWGFDLEKHRRVFSGFRYRFNRERDVLAFCLAAQRLLAGHGSLGAFFSRATRPNTRTWAWRSALRPGLRRTGPRVRLSAQPALVRIQALVPPALDRRGVQAPAAVPPVDGEAGAA